MINPTPRLRRAARHLVLGFLLSVGLAGCLVGTGANKGGIANAPVTAGRNAVGEPCTARVGAATESAPGVGERVYLVRCGSWERPSARIFRLTRGIEQRMSDLQAAIAPNTAWRQLVDQTATCEAPTEAKILDDAPSLVLQCKMKNGGWPYFATATAIDGSVYLADGIPSAFQVMEGVVGRISGKRAEIPEGGERVDRTEAMRRLAAATGDRVFGAGDMNDYFNLIQVGQYQNTIRNYAEAERAYRDALAIHERLNGIDNPEAGDLVSALALEVSNQQRYGEADQLFTRAERLLARTGDKPDLARLLSYKAMHEANQGRRETGLDYAKQATEMRRQIRRDAAGISGGGFDNQVASLAASTGILVNAGYDQAAIDVVQSLHLESTLMNRMGDAPSALKARDEALEILRTTRAKPEWWLPRFVELGADIDEKRGAIDRAADERPKVVSEWRRMFQASRPEGVSEMNLGTTLLAQGRREEALAAFRRGAKTVADAGGGLRFEQVLPYLEALLAETAQRPADSSALYAEMFEAAQIIRGGVTAKSIALASARLSASDEKVGELIREKQEAERERFRLRAEFARLAAVPAETRDRVELNKINEQITAIERKVRDLDSQVQSAAAGYNQLIEQPTTAKSTLALLRPKEALISILVGEQGSFVFVLRDNAITARKLEVTKDEVVASVAVIRQGVVVPASGRLPTFDARESNRLYQRLLAPIADRLEGLDHLVVAPTGALLGLPFALLVTETPAPVRNNDYRQVKWFGQKQALSLVPSVRAFTDLRGRAGASTAPKPFIGFGDFQPSAAQAPNPRDPCAGDARRLAAFTALPATANEVRSIGQALGAGADDILLGADFTGDAVRKKRLDDYRVLYFATHALLPTELECRSQPALLVTRPSGSTVPEAGLLDADSILGLKLDADLVVLSACNTAGPAGESTGESLSGLARAFFYAGARGLLVSHWLVEDRATAELMSTMFGGLRGSGGKSTAEALRQAQAGILNRAGTGGLPVIWSHPLFWSAFTVVGDGARATQVGT